MSAQRSPLPRVAGHAAALLAGAGLALVSVRAMPREHAAGERATVNRTEAASTAFATSNLSSREPTPPNRAAAFRQAWKNLLEKPLAEDDKRRLQHLLLEEWAEVDLDGALDAVAEFMRSEDGQYIPMFNLYSSLFDAFQTKMKKDPEMFWPAIRDGRFGMITGQLRNTWIRNVGDAQPEVLLSHFDDLSPVAREKSLQACLGQFVRKPELKKNVVSQLAGLPDTPDNRALWDTAGQAISDEDPAELAAQLADGASEGERRMLLAGFAASLGGSTQSSAEIRQSLDRLPDAMKQDAVVAILGQGYSSTATFAMADYLLEKQDWVTLQKEAALKLNRLSTQRVDTDAIADWAMKLPEQAETEDLYRSSVRGRIMKEPEQAKDWIMTLPAGWKRDNALTEYVNNSLNYRRDESAAAWAMEHIENPHFQSTAQSMKEKWKAREKE